MRNRNQSVWVTSMLLLVLASAGHGDDLPKSQPLYDDEFKSEIRYPEGEQVRESDVRDGAPSGKNRVFSDVETPTYYLHQADPAKANGVGLVICPGGGYRDVWLDREGHDLAIWLKQFGITSLVLKYRTNGKGKVDGRKYAWAEYMPAVVEDARQAIRVLRKRANELKIDREKIGISGFSAGGNLAMHLYLLADDPPQNTYSGEPDFVGLFYPWFRTDDYQRISNYGKLADLNLFIMNAADDSVTPTDKCVDFYQRLFERGARPELHIVNKGGHGFDLGDGRGASAALWKRSFVAWLKDRGLLEKTNWQTLAPAGFAPESQQKIVADILPDHSIQFDPKTVTVPRVRFAFDKPVTLRRVKMELLPNKQTPSVAWKVGTRQTPPFIYNINPGWTSAEGKWAGLSFSRCVYPPNPDYTDGNCGPHAMVDYIESGLSTPSALPGEDVVEFIMYLREPLPLNPGDEFQLQLDSGNGDGKNDGIGRVRFSYLAL